MKKPSKKTPKEDAWKAAEAKAHRVIFGCCMFFLLCIAGYYVYVLVARAKGWPYTVETASWHQQLIIGLAFIVPFFTLALTRQSLESGLIPRTYFISFLWVFVALGAFSFWTPAGGVAGGIALIIAGSLYSVYRELCKVRDRDPAGIRK